MTVTADFVVAGAGHNSLITAAYLARAGYEVVILDARSQAGGGASTEEILTPGYGFDTCSTGHTLIQVNPVLARDELGLVAEHGLTYVDPDPVAHVLFPDGEHFTMWLDLERTLEEMRRFSSADALAYFRLRHGYDDPAVVGDLEEGVEQAFARRDPQIGPVAAWPQAECDQQAGPDAAADQQRAPADLDTLGLVRHRVSGTAQAWLPNMPR